MSQRRVRAVVAALFAVGMLAGSVHAQVTTGMLAGTVKDAQGGIIPGATVTLVSSSRGTTIATVTTGSAGDYIFANVPADSYMIRVTMDGFKALERSGIAVSPGDRLALQALIVEVGTLSETVTVSAEAPLIQAQSGERSFTVTTAAVKNLPLGNRSFTSLTALTPGVDTSGNNPARLGGGGQNTVMMDGVSTMDTGNNQPVLHLNVEAIEEVKVLTSGYQAEYGLRSGLQITAVTKSGTNRFRGSIYDVRRDSDWNSNSWTNIKNGNPKPVLKQDDWGYSIGGPVGRPGGNNKLFFFFSQEWRPRTTAGSIQRFRFPTALERAGDFSQTRDNNGALFNLIRDASTNLPCTATNTSGCFRDGGVLGRIPQNRLYQTGLNILKMYPMPNLDRPGVAYNYEAPAPEVKTLNNQPALRFDYQPRTGLRAIFKYAGEMQRKQVFPGSVPGFNDVIVPKPIITTLSGTVNYTLNPTTFFEASYGFTQNELAGCTTLMPGANNTGVCANAVPMGAASNKTTVGLADLPVLFPGGLGMDSRYYEFKTLNALNPPFWQNGQLLLPPTFTWGNRIGNSPPNISYPGWLNINRTQDLTMSLTKVWGRHNIKGGVYYHHSYKAQNRGSGGLNFGGPGAMNFANNTSNPIDSGYGFANAALGIINSYTQLSKFVEGNFRYRNVDGYIQDNWKVSNKLTLDYGLRLVHQQPQFDAFLESSNFLPDRWDASQAPVLYVAGCANGVHPCSGNNRQAMNPLTGQFLGPNSALAIGGLVPGTGSQTNGILAAGKGITKTAYQWPALVLGPRFGFAYDLKGNQNLVLRGSGGMFYNRPDGNSIYGLVANPPFSSAATVNFGQLQTLGTSGLSVATPPALTVFEYDAPIQTSIQWSTGIQMALPFASAIDVAYIGQYGYHAGQTVDINQVDIGAAFLPENQDRTLTASATPGATAVSTNQMRGFRGYGVINQYWARTNNRYHSIQTSFNRRFQDGVQYGVNWTLGLSNRGDAPARLEHDASGALRYRADQAKANEILSQQQLQRHVIKAHFVWDLPDLEGNSHAVRTVLAALANDWQLSGIWTGRSGDRYSIGYGYQSGGGNVNITGSPNYGGRVIINGDPGSGCSDNQYQQFNTNVFSGPVPGSVGLESGQNYMVGCFQRILDLAIARNFRLGGSRVVQLRLEMFNAMNSVIFTNRNATINFQTPTDQTITNPQFDALGNVLPNRVRPADAGFGAATAAADLRSMQLQIRFQF